jgi:UDP-N-acetylmuramoyl-tripeptide--D-alanyl-D-alanine ligase
MAELGDTAPAAHAQVAAVVRELGVDRFVAVGTDLYGTEQMADRDAAAALLTGQVRPGDVVLVKASRSAGLDRLAAALVEQELIRQ